MQSKFLLLCIFNHRNIIILDYVANIPNKFSFTKYYLGTLKTCKNSNNPLNQTPLIYGRPFPHLNKFGINIKLQLKIFVIIQYF